MKILHASFAEHRLLLWGETDQADAAPGKRPRPSGKRARAPFVLPYAMPKERLRDVCGVSGWNVGSASAEKAVAWLPSSGGVPYASSPIIAEPPAEAEQAVMAGWEVDALAPRAEDTLAFLLACSGKDLLAPGILIGQDLAFWCKALRLAIGLTVRQMFLPAVRKEGEQYFAAWRPALGDKEQKQFQQLAFRMPPACRALNQSTSAPPDAPASAVLFRFLSMMMDHLVRAANPLAKAARQSFDSIHDQWAHALRSADGKMKGERADLEEFASRIRHWTEPLHAAGDGSFRLCFRLQEPDGEGAVSETWRVEYLLQSTEDPSLLVSAEDVWKADGTAIRLLRRKIREPEQKLLAALGRAAGLYPQIEQTLKTARPCRLELDTPGAVDFLTEKSWLLEQAGFGLLLPAWWTRKGTKVRLTARASVKSPKMVAASGLSMETLVDFQWQIALGGEAPLSYEELQALARLKSPLVKIRGQWVQLNAEEIEAALRFWKKQGTQKATLGEIVRMSLGSAATTGGFPVDRVTTSGWIGDFLAQLEGSASYAEMQASDGFQGVLRPYQIRGFSWLHFLKNWGLGACLADDMGLGKTVQTLALIQCDHRDAADSKRPVLLVCPTSVVGNWQKEAARFTPDLSVLVHHGITRAKGDDFQKAAAQHDLVLSSYSLLQRDFEFLNPISWRAVILDEAQNIKNAETKQSRAARSLNAGYRIVLTGTPVENNVGDLWSIMDFLNPGLLGTKTEFKERFFIPIQSAGDPDAAERLKRITGPFLLRRLKSDKSIIADLPEKMEMKVFCTLTREQASLYQAVLQEMEGGIEEAEGIQRKGMILATLSKLKQVCNHPAHFLGDNSRIEGRSGKLARLTEMLEETIAVGDRVLVFTQFSEMGVIIKQHLQETFGKEVLFLHGQVPKKQRDRMVERFQNDEDEPWIFLLSLKAGGTGLNLTRANHVFHFDRWWNPAVENQATDRAFRIGQRKNVQVHKFVCVGTLEERIDEMIENKKDLAAKVIGTGEAWLTQMSTAQIKSLFALGKDAVEE